MSAPAFLFLQRDGFGLHLVVSAYSISNLIPIFDHPREVTPWDFF